MVVQASRRSRNNVFVRTRAKGALRAFAVATSDIRPLPDFLIIGAKRGGTTSLYDYLLQHPQVLRLFPRPQKIKGVHFFDTNYQRGVAWYRSHFPSAPTRAIVEWATGRRPIAGEASPYYLFHPLAAQRAATTVPNTKLIVLLRNPVDRAYGHYRDRVLHQADPLSFEEAIEREPERLEGEEENILQDGNYRSFAHEHHSYVAQGRYLEPVQRWFSLFPREQVLTLPSEDLFTDPAGTYQRVLRFLNLPPFSGVEFRRRNSNPGPPMDPRTRARLRGLFASENRALAEYLGVDLGCWDT